MPKPRQAHWTNHSARGRSTRLALAASALLAAALVAALLALAPSAAAAGGVAATPGCNPSWPVLAMRDGVPVSLPKSVAMPVACGVDTGYPSSESSLAVSGNGTLIYSPAQSENSLTRSLDGGSTWSLTQPAVEQPTAFWNTVDPFVIADRRTGRLFWSHATGPVRNEGGLPQGSGFYLAAAYGFQVFNSSDNGASWQTADYSLAPTGDWEKLAVGPPPPASTGAAQPSGYPDVVYLCANSPVEVSGPGRLCYKSLDGGTTFTAAGYMSPTASNPQDSCPPLNFNVGVVDNQGTFYTPADCQLAAYVVITRNEGASYTWVRIPGAPTSGPDGGPNVELAVDDAGALYALWVAGAKLDLEVSHDHARTWSAPIVVSAPGVQNIDHPWITAGAPGNVAITYYASPSASAQRLDAYISQSSDALHPEPLFYSGMFNDPAQPIYHDYGLGQDSPRVDFIGGEYDSAGTSFWSGVIKQLGPPDSSGTIATTGYVGHLTFAATATGLTMTPGAAHGFSCGSSSGRLRGVTLGPVRLGMTRARVRRLFGRVRTGSRRYMDFFCSVQEGIRVGYASPPVLGSLPRQQRRRELGRAALALTANRHYALRGVGPGTRLASAARRLEVGKGFHIGANWWYLCPAGPSRGVLKVRHGVIQEIGIADARLIRTRRAALRFLESFD